MILDISVSSGLLQVSCFTHIWGWLGGRGDYPPISEKHIRKSKADGALQMMFSWWRDSRLSLDKEWKVRVHDILASSFPCTIHGAYSAAGALQLEAANNQKIVWDSCGALRSIYLERLAQHLLGTWKIITDFVNGSRKGTRIIIKYIYVTAWHAVNGSFPRPAGELADNTHEIRTYRGSALLWQPLIRLLRRLCVKRHDSGIEWCCNVAKG
jgi:hypothetical protein